MKIALTLPNRQPSAATFTNTMDQIFETYPDVLRYAIDLDAYSSTTFHHSVNVAFQMYDTLSKTANYSKNEILEWTAAAFVHDAGKLATPLDLLHSKEKYRDSVEVNAEKDPYTIMMEHSICGYDVIQKNYNFTPVMQFAVIGHHIDAKAIDNGPVLGFAGASESRRTWDKSFPNHQIEKTLCENFSWITHQDASILKLLTILDSAEAMRSTERLYNNRKAMNWSVVNNILQKDAEAGKIDKAIADRFQNKQVQDRFSQLQSEHISQSIRKLVAEKGQDIPYKLSVDKIEEIKQNPSLGETFMRDGDLFKIVSGEMDIDFNLDYE